MKKIYNQPTCLVVQLGSRDALLQAVSSSDLEGTTTSSSGTEEENIVEGDVKGLSSNSIWDEEW